MSNKIFLVGVFISCAFVVCAKPFSSNKPYSEMTPEERAIRHKEAEENRQEYFGGKVEKAGSQKGRILIVDESVDGKGLAINEVINSLTSQFKYNIESLREVGGETTPLDASKKLKEKNANIAIFVVDNDKSDDILIVAPENGWAILNVAALNKGAKNDAFRSNRFKRELARAYNSVCGAMNSNFAGSLMGTVTNVEDIDRLGDAYPMDVVQRVKESLEKRGVTPKIISTYRNACKQGWAPAPTNDVQKAIWNEIHQLPSLPIKIKYDPKSDGK